MRVRVSQVKVKVRVRVRARAALKAAPRLASMVSKQVCEARVCALSAEPHCKSCGRSTRWMGRGLHSAPSRTRRTAARPSASMPAPRLSQHAKLFTAPCVLCEWTSRRCASTLEMTLRRLATSRRCGPRAASRPQKLRRTWPRGGHAMALHQVLHLALHRVLHLTLKPCTFFCESMAQRVCHGTTLLGTPPSYGRLRPWFALRL